jgi:hypothetical protein
VCDKKCRLTVDSLKLAENGHTVKDLSGHRRLRWDKRRHATNGRWRPSMQLICPRGREARSRYRTNRNSRTLQWPACGEHRKCVAATLVSNLERRSARRPRDCPVPSEQSQLAGAWALRRAADEYDREASRDLTRQDSTSRCWVRGRCRARDRPACCDLLWSTRFHSVPRS